MFAVSTLRCASVAQPETVRMVRALKATNPKAEAEVEESPSQRAYVATTPSGAADPTGFCGTWQHPGHDPLEAFKSPLHSPLLSDHPSLTTLSQPM
jgi:hypothetical protein